MPTQIDKLQAHAGHLLDSFIHLRERYAMLEPLLFGPSSAPAPSNPYAAKGYHILRQSLLLSCCQDIAKLCLDKDDRTPSIRNLVTPLTEVAVRDALRDQFSVWRLPRTTEDDDPDIAAALQRIELREESERRTQFEDLLCELTDTWAALSTRPALDSFATIRNKLTAHTEVRYVADKYQLIDIGSLGLKWQDLKDTIDLMQKVVELLGQLIRNTNFAWDLLDDQLTNSAAAFWQRPSGAS
jgi:hypothetical protein